jgi:hypothetical protein
MIECTLAGDGEQHRKEYSAKHLLRQTGRRRLAMS